MFLSFCSFPPMFHLFLGGISFLYIVPPIASEPSTCMTQGINLDICPIKALLEVLECVVTCELWDYCSGITLLLMRLVELVQYIECGADDYFTQIFLLFFTCTSLLSSSMTCPLVQVTSWGIPEERLLFRLLGCWVFASSLLRLLSTCPAQIGERMGLFPSPD